MCPLGSVCERFWHLVPACIQRTGTAIMSVLARPHGRGANPGAAGARRARSPPGGCWPRAPARSPRRPSPRGPRRARTRPRASTTASGSSSRPIRQLPTGWWKVSTVRSTWSGSSRPRPGREHAGSGAARATSISRAPGRDRGRAVGGLEEPAHLDHRLVGRVAALQAHGPAPRARVGDLDVEVGEALAALDLARVRHHLVDAPLPADLVGAGQQALVPGARPGRGLEGEIEAVGDLRVVLHPPPDARPSRRTTGDAVAGELVGRADARAKQRRRGRVGAERHHDRVGAEATRRRRRRSPPRA